MADSIQKNCIGGQLQSCCQDPITGFLRDGYCHSHKEDHGMHFVCAVMTEDFLRFSKAQGNDLSTPRPEFGFPGLNSGDSWCLCALRWQQAFEAQSAPQVKLKSTHIDTLKHVKLADLKSCAFK